jgi:hypothetical protein
LFLSSRSWPSLPLSIALALALLAGFGSYSVSADDSTPAKPVTARPPREAVPATPVTKTLHTHMRQCNAAADAKQLHGAPREAFVRDCMSPRHTNTPARGSASR